MDERESTSLLDSVRDWFPSGRGYVPWFGEGELREEMSASGLDVEVFCSAEEHGGSALMRLAVLQKPQ